MHRRIVQLYHSILNSLSVDDQKLKMETDFLFTLQVCVEVDDNDDVTPVFPSDVIRLEFREDIPVSTVVYVARATTGASANSSISYRLDPDSNNDDDDDDDDVYFSIDRWSGVVRLRRPLDRERKHLHRFTIAAATDNQNTGYLNVLLSVLDTNDHHPVFSRPSYTCHVTSTTSCFDPPCSVTATDADEDENGRVVYFLSADDDVADFFLVDPHTGTIHVNRSAPSNRTLTVVAMDAGASPRKSSALVTVTSDVSPGVNCAAASLLMKIEENRPAYSVVGSVRFTYDDGTTVAVTRYQLNKDGGQQTFDIDVKTGEIVTTSMLDRELCSNYSLKVSAAYALPGLYSSKITNIDLRA